MNYGFFFTEASDIRNKISYQYEPIQPLFLLHLASFVHATKFFDIGANIGLYSLIMSLVQGMKNIYSFEASDDTFSNLLTNIRMNNLDQFITPQCLAISDKNGVVEFLTESPLSGINSIAATSIHNRALFRNVTEVQSRKLDSLFNSTNEVIALKIDVEGHEYHVLKGAENLLKNNQCVVQCESYSNENGDTKELFSQFGYERISNIGSDNYYSNISLLFDSGTNLKLLETAICSYIDYNLGRWRSDPRAEGIRLHVEKEGDYIKCGITVSEGIFMSLPEYAFYLYVDKNLVCEINYSKSNDHYFLLTDYINISNDSHVVSVSGFVRDATLPAKKLSTNVTLSSRC